MKNSGRSQLLNFINEFSGTQHSKIEELASGVAYLNAFSKLFPKVVSHKKMIENPKHDGDAVKNFEILVQYFKRCRVPRSTPDIYKLSKGNFQSHIEFLQWLCEFVEKNGKTQFFEQKSTFSPSTNGSVFQPATVQLNLDNPPPPSLNINISTKPITTTSNPNFSQKNLAAPSQPKSQNHKILTTTSSSAATSSSHNNSLQQHPSPRPKTTAASALQHGSFSNSNTPRGPSSANSSMNSQHGTPGNNSINSHANQQKISPNSNVNGKNASITAQRHHFESISVPNSSRSHYHSNLPEKHNDIHKNQHLVQDDDDVEDDYENVSNELPSMSSSENLLNNFNNFNNNPSFLRYNNSKTTNNNDNENNKLINPQKEQHQKLLQQQQQQLQQIQKEQQQLLLQQQQPKFSTNISKNPIKSRSNTTASNGISNLKKPTSENISNVSSPISTANSNALSPQSTITDNYYNNPEKNDENNPLISENFFGDKAIGNLNVLVDKVERFIIRRLKASSRAYDHIQNLVDQISEQEEKLKTVQYVVHNLGSSKTAKGNQIENIKEILARK